MKLFQLAVIGISAAAAAAAKPTSTKHESCSTRFGWLPRPIVHKTTATITKSSVATVATTVTKTTYSSTVTVPTPTGFTPITNAKWGPNAQKTSSSRRRAAVMPAKQQRRHFRPPRPFPESVYCSITTTVPGSTTTETRTKSVHGDGTSTYYEGCNPDYIINEFDGHAIFDIVPGCLGTPNVNGRRLLKRGENLAAEDCCALAFGHPDYQAIGFSQYFSGGGGYACAIAEVTCSGMPEPTSSVFEFFTNESQSGAGGRYIGNGPFGTGIYSGMTTYS